MDWVGSDFFGDPECDVMWSMPHIAEKKGMMETHTDGGSGLSVRSIWAITLAELAVSLLVFCLDPLGKWSDKAFRLLPGTAHCSLWVTDVSWTQLFSFRV